MSSILPSFEYDIFISYRHNDNRSGWVTDFVNTLKLELGTVIKSPISVYFDTNFADGLLELHHVDKSLENKLKSIILIPIISQTYCDQNSFAWKNEFCTFNAISSKDTLGREIRLPSGNVASRILPVKIHDLDKEDEELLEKELGGVLRAIEFIYKEPGINRPLTRNDRKSENYNKTDYHNQINKLAHTIKEMVYGVTGKKISENTSKPSGKTTEEVSEKPSIAVLPFGNRSSEPDKDYFSEGITENIIFELAGNRELRTISRTSVMRYKNATKSIPEIAAELKVRYILEGLVQLSGNAYKINVQLIDATLDDHIWSKVFRGNVEDVFTLQEHVAEVVANELNVSLLQDKTNKREKSSKNPEAYDLWLKGRHAFNQWGVEGYKTATKYFKQALELDPEFIEACSSLASAYSARMSWNGDLSPEEAKAQIEPLLDKIWQYEPSMNDYLTKGFVEFFISKDFEMAEQYFLKAIEAGPSEAGALYAYSYLLNMTGRFSEACTTVEKAGNIDPLTPAFFNYKFLCHYFSSEYSQALETLEEGLKLYPGVIRFYDYLGRLYITEGKFQEAAQAVVIGLGNPELRPPSMVTWLALSYNGLGKDRERDELRDELIKRSGKTEKGVNIYLSYLYSETGDMNTAEYWYQMAQKTNDVDLIWWDIDPLLEDLRDWVKEINKTVEPDFIAAEHEIIGLLKDGLPTLSYHNMEHIEDVVNAVREIAINEKVSDEELKLLVTAAWYHDSGFIVSGKDHEMHSVTLAKKHLPKHGFSAKQMEIIAGMIMATRLPQSPRGKLESILCDADLDYLGREDFYAIGDRLFEEMKKSGVVETRREWNLVQKTFLQSHKYHTQYVKDRREQQKQNRITEITESLKSP